MTGVLLPPIEAGKVVAGASRFSGRPFPLKSIPAKGDRLRTGFLAGVIFARQSVLFPCSPTGGSDDSASRTVGRRSRVIGWTETRWASRVPTRNIRVLACGTPYSDAFKIISVVSYSSSSARRLSPAIRGAQRRFRARARDVLHDKRARLYAIHDLEEPPNVPASWIAWVHFPCYREALARRAAYDDVRGALARDGPFIQ